MAEFDRQKTATLEGASWNEENMEQFKSPRHKLNMYNYLLKEYGIKKASEYAEVACIKGNLERYLPQCDPWRDHDSCFWHCNYYNTSLGCMLFYVDLKGVNKDED